MLKIFKKIIIPCLIVCFLFSMAGCTSNTVKVTFKQSGWADVVVMVNKGETLSPIPNPKRAAGYDIVWDRTDFTNLQEDIIVNAVKTPKEYTITYDLGSRQGDNFAHIESYEQKAIYKQKVITYKPTCSGYAFLGWDIKDKNITFNDEVYIYAEDITLVARWEVSDNDDDRFSPIIPSN